MKRAKPKPVIYERDEVLPLCPADFGGEEVRGLEGMLVYLGRGVRVLPRVSESLRTTVPARSGVVCSMYRRPGNPRVIVETSNGHSFYADQVLASRTRGYR